MTAPAVRVTGDFWEMHCKMDGGKMPTYKKRILQMITLKQKNYTSKHFQMHIKAASDDLTSIKLFISVRVVLRSPSKTLHLHKIKDGHFLCHWLPIGCTLLPRRDDLGPPRPTWGQSINTQHEHLVSRRLKGQARITGLLFSSVWITHVCTPCWILTKMLRDNIGRSWPNSKLTGFLSVDVYLTQAKSINAVWDFKLLVARFYL